MIILEKDLSILLIWYETLTWVKIMQNSLMSIMTNHLIRVINLEYLRLITVPPKLEMPQNLTVYYDRGFPKFGPKFLKFIKQN